jgi:hypothetical protein
MLKECMTISEPVDPSIHPGQQPASEAVVREPMSILRSIGIGIRGSQLQRYEFKAAIAAANRTIQACTAETNRQAHSEARLTGNPQPTPVEPKLIDECVPFGDCETRWGSRYMMLERGLYLREVCLNFTMQILRCTKE